MRKIVKPPALWPKSTIAVISPASPASPARLASGAAELERLGYGVRVFPCEPENYFAGSAAARLSQLLEAIRSEKFRAVIGLRGGFGSTYILDALNPGDLGRPRILLGYSDITSLQIFLWQKLNWVTFYGPMAAAGFDSGASKPCGYDQESFTRAVTETRSGFTLKLHGEALLSGEAEGVLLGGCMTLIESTIGTPWELDTAGSILILEDCAMKPYQVDRTLTHLRQAGKFRNVKGIILGEFPESNPPLPNSPTVRDVCKRILGDLKIPVVWGASIGHTPRPLLTVPLGVSARLIAAGEGNLKILEPCVAA